jgi:hypothetical protein
MEPSRYRVFHALAFIESNGGEVFIRASTLAAFIPNGYVRLADDISRGVVEQDGV